MPLPLPPLASLEEENLEGAFQTGGLFSPLPPSLDDLVEDLEPLS